MEIKEMECLSHVQNGKYYDFLKIMIPIWNRCDEPWGVKDESSRFVYVNDSFLKLLNLPLNYKIAGMLHENMPSETAKFARQFQENDKLVASTLKRVTSIETHPFGESQKISSYLFDKIPLFNKDNEYIGNMFHGRKFEILDINLFYTNKLSGAVTFYSPSALLTDREWDVVFLKLRGENNKEISRILKISRRTVEKIISSIYDKCEVSSWSALRGFLIRNGYDNFIPGKFIKSPRSLTL
ncbi:PAS and helix-turn-helix domain-containing protein [Pantoea sp. At-9b]|uniref:helix-turn-helix transcriptional regulator n=1 Tax=Pantoea sp. (strain At-9b) TaxID=592316 RepID=UPI0001B3DEB6|nr:PAS and helix-turn-helix domain-containing protein [Pantoea sp. At-9b]ADU71475.1 transcriptional regulator, LuxR family [Pantoea sp. At-9b]